MVWTVNLHEQFEKEFDNLPQSVQTELLAKVQFLEQIGFKLGRPMVDTLKGSKFSNMKELRFNASSGVWRVAFAFDTKREAILLVAGDKSGMSQTLFYKQLIKKADERYQEHINKLEKDKSTDEEV